MSKLEIKEKLNIIFSLFLQKKTQSFSIEILNIIKHFFIAQNIPYELDLVDGEEGSYIFTYWDSKNRQGRFKIVINLNPLDK